MQEKPKLAPKKWLRVRLFWVKMISGNHFPPNPHVWLSRKMIFSGKWLPVDQYFHLWPGNDFAPSFSLQIISEKREREREREREPRLEREREKREPRSCRSSDDCTVSTSGAIDDRDRRDRVARSMRSRGAIVDRAARSRSSIAPLVDQRSHRPRLR